MQTVDTILTILYWPCIFTVWLHVFSQRGSNLRHEVLPFAWIAGAFIGGRLFFWEAPKHFMEAHVGWLIFDVFFALVYALYSWLAHREWKNDDDDRWKKRRKKVTAKVKEIGGKLVVSPEPEAVRVTA